MSYSYITIISQCKVVTKSCFIPPANVPDTRDSRLYSDVGQVTGASGLSLLSIESRATKVASWTLWKFLIQMAEGGHAGQ